MITKVLKLYWKFIDSMVADSRHREKNVQNREKTFIIKKKLEKNFRIQKNISGSKTKL